MSADQLEGIFTEIESLFGAHQSLVRVVLSGRRRNMQTPHERIDMRPVLIKSSLQIQLTYSDGRAMTTKNYVPNETPLAELLRAGFANILLEQTSGSISVRITKKGEPLIHRTSEKKEQILEHDRTKSRLLQPSDPFLIAVGISDTEGNLKPSKADKYRQVEEFLRLLAPTLKNAIDAGHIAKPSDATPLTIVDLGCGHAYLTFAAHQYLRSIGMNVKVVGIDVRTASRDRNNEIAKKLGITDSIEFRAEEIAATTLVQADVAIALHACDTATDDSIAWAVKNSAKVIMLAPCCHHDLQAQIDLVPEPWSLLTRHGVVSERLIDLMTDSLRAQILKLLGYRVDIVEFIGGEHTPRNIMIRAVKTGVKVDPAEVDRYQAMLADWSIAPHLAELLKSELSARI